MERFVLIDGNAILHRAYHALPTLTSRSGELVNAVYGFTTMLFKVISDLKPKYLAVAFDTEKPTFRHQEYIGYQAQRPKMAEELAGQIEKVHQVLVSMGIPIFQREGFEADDVIGTLANQVIKKKKKIEVLIVSGDRDITQLIKGKIKVYVPLKGLSEAKIFDEKEVKEKIGVFPWQIPDFKGLVGDPSDNYPGVPGIGPKTAVELLKRFKTLEEIYQNLDKVGKFFPKGVVEKLIQGRELAELSKKLATIVLDVPLKIDLERCRFFFGEKEKERVIQKFREFGFKSLISRISGSEKDSSKSLASKKEIQERLF
jgi:DNA polymerase-1